MNLSAECQESVVERRLWPLRGIRAEPRAAQAQVAFHRRVRSKRLWLHLYPPRSTFRAQWQQTTPSPHFENPEQELILVLDRCIMLEKGQLAHRGHCPLRLTGSAQSAYGQRGSVP